MGIYECDKCGLHRSECECGVRELKEIIERQALALEKCKEQRDISTHNLYGDFMNDAEETILADEKELEAILEGK